MNIRFAKPEDAQAFSNWAARNPQISRDDILAASKAENPTTTFLVVEEDGEPVFFVPVFLTMRIGYLGFKPGSSKDTREAAMEKMLEFIRALAGLYSINTVDTLTRSGIPVAEWARAHGFHADPRELFQLRVNNKVSPQEGPAH